MTERSLLEYFNLLAKSGPSVPIAPPERLAQYHDLSVTKVKSIVDGLNILGHAKQPNPYRPDLVISPNPDLPFPQTLEQLELLKQLYLTEASTGTQGDPNESDTTKHNPVTRSKPLNPPVGIKGFRAGSL